MCASSRREVTPEMPAIQTLESIFVNQIHAQSEGATMLASFLTYLLLIFLLISPVIKRRGQFFPSDG